MSKCLLHSRKKTKSKYGEAVVHSGGSTKHSVLLMWKSLGVKKICRFFLCQQFCVTLFTDSLPQNATVGPWVYSEPNVVMLLRAWLSQYLIYLPKPLNPGMSELVFCPIVT